MKRLTMKHLRYFEALARHRHFGNAAEDCAISQPALSLQIKELEEILGAALVERSARQIRLTGLGEAFVLRARAILNAVQDLGDLARASTGPLSGRLRIGVIPTVAPYLLPRLIKGLTAAYSGLELHPREAVTQRLIDDLAEGQLDVALVALPVSERWLEEYELLAEEFLLVRPEVDAARPVPDPATLSELRLLLLEEGHCFRDQAISYCKLSAPSPRNLMEGSSLTTLVQMVGAGIGVTLIPQMAQVIETRSAPVSVVRLPAPRPSRRIGLVWRRTNPLAGQFHDLASILRDVIAGD